jgi:AcrR family transcriptional regulator
VTGRAAALVGRVLDATYDEVAEHGLGALTVEAVAVRAGSSRATVYRHFPGGRDELLRAAYARAGEQLIQRAEAAAEGVHGWHARILSYARTMIEYSSAPRLGHFYSISGPHLMGFRAERGVGAQGYFESFRAGLATAADDGELLPGVHPTSLAILLASSLRDAAIAVAGGEVTVDEVMASVRMLIDGLTCLSRPDGRGLPRTKI